MAITPARHRKNASARHAAAVRRRFGAKALSAALSASLIAGLLLALNLQAPAAEAQVWHPKTSAAATATAVLGEDLAIDITIENDSSAAQYNLSVAVLLPPNTSYVSSPYGEPTRIYEGGATLPGQMVGEQTCESLGLEPGAGAGACVVPEGFTYLVFQNISDLPAGAAYPAPSTDGGPLVVRPSAGAYGVGEEIDVRVNAYTSSQERFIPVFPGSTGIASADARTATSGTVSAEIDETMQALRIEKSEPSPESELLRGVHDNTTVYTLTVHHTGEGDLPNGQVVDYLPAGLEYLGSCSLSDNTTDAAPEYEGAGALDTSDVDHCVEEASIETIAASADEAATYGLVEGAVYTRVTWDLGTLLAADSDESNHVDGTEQSYPAAAGTPATTTIQYRAGIPLFENALFDGDAPTPESLEQGANLDNNTGASTRHGTDEAGDTAGKHADSWTNVAVARGTWDDVVTEDSDAESVDAVDVRVLKDVRVGNGDWADWPSTASFEQGSIADYRLQISTSEYVQDVSLGERPTRLVDDLADGLCPAFPADVPVTGGGEPNFMLGDPNDAEDDDYVDAADFNAALSENGAADCAWPQADADATWEGVTLTGIGFNPVTGNFFLDMQLDPTNVLDQPNANHTVIYSAQQNTSYVQDGLGATSLGDSVTNNAEIEAFTNPRAATEDLTTPGAPDGVGDEFFAFDDSEATVQAGYSSISKKVLPRGTDITDGISGDLPWTDVAAEPFAIGDDVWFQLAWTPLDDANARNAELTDFLPEGLAFDHAADDNVVIVAKDASGNVITNFSDYGVGTEQPTTEAAWLDAFVNLVPADAAERDERRLNWELGSAAAFDGSDRFFPRGVSLEIFVQATVTEVQAYGDYDLSQNLVKFQQENVDGEVFFLRDEADFTLDMSATLVKGIAHNSYNDSEYGIGSDQDGGTAVQGDEVRFRIDVTAPGAPTTGFVIWDALPEGITAADLGAASGANVPGTAAYVWTDAVAGDSLTHTAVVFDAEDSGRPDDVGSAYDGRSIVVWTVTDAVAASSGDSDDRIERGFSLEYTVEVPNGAEDAGALLDQRYVNTAAVVQFDIVNNGGGNTTLIPEADGATVTPGGEWSGSVAPVSTRTASDDEVGIPADGMTDPSDFRLPLPTMSKALIGTEIAESDTTPTDPNNLFDDVTQGEYAMFQLRVDIPAHTTVLNGVLSDSGSFTWSGAPANSPTGRTHAYTPVSAELIAAQSVEGAPLPTGFEFDDVTGELQFPDYYQNDTDNSQAFIVSITVWIDDRDASNPTHTPDFPQWKQLTNTASFAFESNGEEQSIDDDEQVRFVEPLPTLRKGSDTDSAGLVEAGGEVEYTLTAGNTGGRPTLYDAVVWDCVPAGIEVDESSFTAADGSPAAGTVSASPLSCEVVDGEIEFAPDSTGTLIRWSGFDLAGGQELTLSYTGAVDPLAGGAAEYTNEARLTGFTLPSELDDEDTQERRGDRVATTSETVRVNEAGIVKEVAPASAPIGDTVTYTLTTTLPSHASYYDVQLTDSMPAGIEYIAGSTEVTFDGWDDIATPQVGTSNDDGEHEPTASGRTLEWAIDSADIALHTEQRTITVTFDALVTDEVGTPLTHTNSAFFAWNQTADGDPSERDQTRSDSATVTILHPVLGIAKTVDSEDSITRNPDASFDYAVTVTNSGETAAFETVVVDDVPEGVVVDEGTISDGGTLSEDGRTITWLIAGAIEPGAANAMTLTYTASFADSDELGTDALENVVEITEYTSWPDDGDDRAGRTYVPGQNGVPPAEADADVRPLFPFLTLEKTVTTPVAGEDYGVTNIDESLNWTLSVTNSGEGTAHDIVVIDTLPEHWVYETGTAQLWFGDTPVTLADPAEATTDDVTTLTWSSEQLETAGLPEALAAGAGFRVTFDASPTEALASDETTGIGIEARAHVNSLSAAANDSTGADENADGGYVGDDDDARAYLPQVDLGVEKIALNQPLTAGDDPVEAWQITLTNHGPDAAQGPFTISDVTEALPAGVTITGIAGEGWTGEPPVRDADGVTSFERVYGDETTVLANGASLPAITVTVTVAADQPVVVQDDALVNTATVEPGRNFDPNPDNDESEDGIWVVTSADLAIVKTATDADTATAGGTVTWELQVVNHGPSVSVSTADNPITVTDTVPAGVTVAEAPANAGWTASAAQWPAVAGDEITFTYDGEVMPLGEAEPILLTGDIASSHMGSITNEAEVVPGDTPDPEDPNNEDEESFDPGDGTDVRIVKHRVVADGEGGWAITTDPVVPGTDVSYRITVYNDGPADAREVVVVDEAPDALSYLSFSNVEGDWSHDDHETEPNWSTFALAGTQEPGADSATSFVVTYRLDASYDTAEELVNWVEVDAVNDEEFDEDEQRDSSSTESNRLVDLGVVKTHLGDGPFDAGTQLDYLLTVTNHGPSTTNGVITVTDTLPEGLTYTELSATVTVGGVPTQLEPEVDGQTLVWEVMTDADAFAVDGSFTIEFSTDIAADLAPQTLRNTVLVDGPDEDPNGDNDRDDDEVPTTTFAEMQVVKDVEAGPWVAGTEVEYTLTVVNDGPSIVDASIEDTLPPGLTLVSFDATGDWVCDEAGIGTQTLECEHALHPLGSAGSTSIAVVAAVDAGVPTATELVNEVDLTWNDRRGSHLDEDEAQITVTAIADLGLKKTAVDEQGEPSSRVVAGENAQFLLEIVNYGPSDAVGPLTVTDTLPLGMTFVSAEADGWSVTATEPEEGTEQQVTLTRDAGLAFGADTVEILLTVHVAHDIEQDAELTNIADVTSPTDEPAADPNPNEDPETVITDRAVDLAVLKTHDPAQVRITDELPFSISVTNNGPSTASGIVVTDEIPAGLEVVSMPGDEVGEGWTLESVTLVDEADPAGGAVVVASYEHPLAPGEEAEELTITALVTAGAYEEVVNVVTVEGIEPDTDDENNRDEDPVTVPPMATLTVEKTLVGELQVGKQGTYSITLVNDGPTADPGPITVTDWLPNGLSFASSPDEGVRVEGSTVIWTLEEGLEVGESVEFTLVVDVAEAAYPSVANIVIVDTPTELTPESVRQSTVTSPVAAADSLPKTGQLLAWSIAIAALLLALLGAWLVMSRRRSLTA